MHRLLEAHAMPRSLAAAFIALAMLWASATAAQQHAKTALISINDVYQIEGVENGKAGGMARVRALRAEVEKAYPQLLMLHAGDFLSPSFLGRTYFGAQMIDLMNMLDGNPASGTFDARMFVAFGNHEFDDTHCGRDGPLSRLIARSEFTWLASNLDFSRCDRLKALTGAPNIATSRIVRSGGLKIGLLGVTLAYPAYAAIVLDPVAVACAETARLRAEGVDAVVAVTHLKLPADLALLGLDQGGRPVPLEKRACADPPDLLIGGHEHVNNALPTTAPRLFKADADAVSAWVIEIEKAPRRALKIKGRLVQLDEKRAVDPMVARIAQDWIRRHDERFCVAECAGQPPEKRKACLAAAVEGTCLAEAYVRTAQKLETEEIYNRSQETAFGDWLADQMREAGKADVAFLNAGAIRINQDLPADTMLTRRHLEQMFPFKDKLAIREVSGGDLWRAMEHAVAQRGEGPWAHFSGMAVELAAKGGDSRIARMKVKRGDGSVVDVRPETTALFKMAALPFVLANGDGHGFRVCPGESDVTRCMSAITADPRWPLDGDGADLAGLVRLRLGETDKARGLEIAVDRRLCEYGQKDCLIARW